MEKNQNLLNSHLSKKVLEDRIRRYVKNASKGKAFTVEDVSNAIHFNDYGFIENKLIWHAYNDRLEKQGSKFIKKDYSAKDIFNIVLREISTYGHFQPSSFLKLNKDIQEERLSEILEKGSTEYGWVRKDEDGEIVYFR